MTDRSHYVLDGKGGIDITPAADPRPCVVYLHPQTDVLCIIEGAAYHQFKLDDRGMARIAAECAKRLWDRAK